MTLQPQPNDLTAATVDLPGLLLLLCERLVQVEFGLAAFFTHQVATLFRSVLRSTLRYGLGGFMRTFLAAIFLTSLGSAHSGTLTATCTEPSGRALGFRGELGRFAKVDEVDGMKGGVINVLWEVDANEAAISIKSSGGSLHASKGILAYRSTEQVSFVVIYPGAVFLYSLFPASSTILVSDHGLSLGFEPKSAIVKSYQAKCEVRIQ